MYYCSTERDNEGRAITMADSLTLRELLEDSGLELTLLAGSTAIDRSVAGVYIGDMPDPTPWMAPGSLLLTTGPRLEAEPESGSRLIRLLRDAGMVGVGVAIEPHIHAIPATVIDKAEKCGVALLRVPPETLFREIADYVFEALSSRDIHRLRQQTALQNKLLEATLHRDDTEHLLTVLASLLHAEVILLSANGSIEAQSRRSADELEVDELCTRLWSTFSAAKRRQMPRSMIHLDRVDAHCREVSIDGVLRQVLVAIRPADSLFSDFEGMALSFAEQLIELSLVADETATTARRKTRHGLLEQLLSERSERVSEERLLAHGLEYSASVRIMAASLAGPNAQRPRRATFIDDTHGLLSRLDESFESEAIPFLSLEHRDLVLVLYAEEQGEDERAALKPMGVNAATQLRGRSHEIAFGVSARGALQADAGKLLDQALLAMSVAESTGEGWVAYETLSAGHRIVDSLEVSAIESLAAPLATELEDETGRRKTPLLPTLEAFLKERCSIGRTADACFLHPNSVRKRLRAIDRLLDIDLTTTEGVAEAYLRLLARNVLRARSRYTSPVEPARPSGLPETGRH